MVLQTLKTGMIAPYTAKNVLGNDINLTSGNIVNNLYQYIFYANYGASVNPASNNQLSLGTYIDVGFGDTPVTSDDLQLADGNMDVITGYSGASVPHPIEGKKYLSIVGQSNNTKSAKESCNKTIVYKNITENTVTVKEIGLYIALNNLNQASAWASSMPLFLVFRKVLDTPIVFAPNDVYAITYRIALDI